MAKKVIEISAVDNYSEVINKINQQNKQATDEFVRSTDKRILAIREEQEIRNKAFEETKQKLSEETAAKIKSNEQQFNKKSQTIIDEGYNEDFNRIKQNNDKKQRQLDLDLKNKVIKNDKFNKEQAKLKEKFIVEQDKLETKYNKKGIDLDKEQEKEKLKIINNEVTQLSKLDKEHNKELSALEKKQAIIGKQIGSQSGAKDQLAMSMMQGDVRGSIGGMAAVAGIGGLAGGAIGIMAGLVIEKVSKVIDTIEGSIKQGIGSMASGLSSGNLYGSAVSGIGGIASTAANLLPIGGGITSSLIGGITQIMGSAVAQAGQTEISNKLVRNMTGRGVGGQNFRTMAEFGGYERQFAQQRGMGDQTATMRELRMERGMGYDFGAFSGLNKFQRTMGAGNSTDALYVKFLTKAASSELWGVEKKNFTQIGDVLNKGLLPLMQSEISFFNSAKGGRAGGILAGFSGLKDGGWGNIDLASQRIQMLDQGIKSPTSPFMDAIIKGSILKGNAGIGLSGLKDIQAQGIMNPQTMVTMLQSLQASGMSSEYKHLFLQSFAPSLTGNKEARDALLNNIPKVTEIMGSNMSNEERSKALQKLGISGDLGKQEKTQIEVLNNLERLGERIVDSLEPYVPKMAKGIDLIGDGFTIFLNTSMAEMGVMAGKNVFDMDVMGDWQKKHGILLATQTGEEAYSFLKEKGIVGEENKKWLEANRKLESGTLDTKTEHKTIESLTDFYIKESKKYENTKLEKHFLELLMVLKQLRQTQHNQTNNAKIIDKNGNKNKVIPQ